MIFVTRHLVARGVVLLFAAAGFCAALGCAERKPLPTVFYCEGAGWYSSAGSVKSGLQRAGFRGRFRNYGWSSYLGATTDHLITARSRLVARGLARRIENLRAAQRNAQLGTALALVVAAAGGGEGRPGAGLFEFFIRRHE